MFGGQSLFDAPFFETVLPDLVRSECENRPQEVPVVELRLADGATLDVCHVAQLTPGWLTLAVFRAPERCDDMDLVFVPYGLVTRITLSLRPRAERRLGFRTAATVTDEGG